jgi:hypothetical protein
MGYSRAGGKLIQEKNQKQNILWHSPFKGTVSQDFAIQNIFLAACFQKTGGFALYWPLARAKFACGCRPVAFKFYPVSSSLMQHE